MDDCALPEHHVIVDYNAGHQYAVRTEHTVSADNGIGMAKEDVPRVMEPFAQVESAQSRVNGGTGLGLPLSKKIAELHDAAFSIESELGRGTIVKVLLPAVRVLGTNGEPQHQENETAA